MRLNKFISHHGICSRRQADQLIENGEVKVNNIIMRTPYIVQDNDVISVYGKVLKDKPKQKIWAYHKPTGVITSHHDTHDRPIVFDQPAIRNLGHVISVGRLDINSEGLLLITNDPSFAHEAEDPKNKWERVYRVRIYGEPDYDKFKRLRDGITIEGIHYDPILVEYEKQATKNQWILVTLTEGKNREIRTVFNHLGLQVSRLIRVAYGPYELGDLEQGQITRIK